MSFAVKMILIILCIIVFVFLMLATIVVMVVSHPPCATHESHLDSDDHREYVKIYDTLPKEEYLVKSFDGYELHTVYIPAAEPSDKYIIVSHGYTSNYHSSIKYMLMFREWGYNGIIYDDRRHGYNKKKHTVCSLGVFESKDLMEIICDTRRRFGENIYIGLHGESMGSGMSVMALAYQPGIHFLINDCGYADMKQILYSQMYNLFRMPKCMVRPACAIGKLFYGFSYHDIRPIDVLADNHVPICFIHGEDDDFIIPEHSERMHEETGGYSEIHLFPNARHAESFKSDAKRYYKIVENFLERVYDSESGGKNYETTEYSKHD